MSGRIRSGLPLLNRILRSDSLSAQSSILECAVVCPAVTSLSEANPMKLVNRVKKIQDDLTTLKEQCRDLLAAKQELFDVAQTTLVGNRNLLRRMQTSMGVPLASADEDTSFANFNQIVDE